MAADRRTPVTKAGKPAAKKIPANAAAASAVATAVATKPATAPPAAAVKTVPVKTGPAKPAAVLARYAATAATKPMPPKAAAKNDYALDEQVGFHLRRAHQRATVIFNEVMAQFDITPTQFAALAKIDDEGSISQNHLGRLTAMDPSTILGVIGRLARQGLVHLRSTPGDARLTMIELTLDGQKRVAEMKALALEVSKRTLAPLKPADAKTLNELLARIC
jgi:MarR family transcriptional regulator, lower aerobic nicotinate degradation pathway regulator